MLGGRGGSVLEGLGMISPLENRLYKLTDKDFTSLGCHETVPADLLISLWGAVCACDQDVNPGTEIRT